jgi:hypothetical protein
MPAFQDHESGVIACFSIHRGRGGVSPSLPLTAGREGAPLIAETADNPLEDRMSMMSLCCELLKLLDELSNDDPSPMNASSNRNADWTSPPANACPLTEQ